jgi:hypothetical protein
MTTATETRMIEDRYHEAIQRLVVRLVLIVSIAGMAQYLSHHLG